MMVVLLPAMQRGTGYMEHKDLLKERVGVGVWLHTCDDTSGEYIGTVRGMDIMRWRCGRGIGIGIGMYIRTN